MATEAVLEPTRASIHARRLLWTALLTLTATVIVGRAWDGYWHAVHVFDSFFSPPHVFVYSMTGLTLLLVAAILCRPALARSLGPATRFPHAPFDIPGPALLVAAGFGGLITAGLLLDNAWHTAFGWDETMWSAPHAMMGWAWYTITLGFAGCLRGAAGPRPLSSPEAVVLGLVLLAFSTGPFLGPLHRYPTPDSLRAMMQLPALTLQPTAARTFDTYLDWNLTRANPLLVPLGAVWAGTSLAVLRGIDRRTGILLLTTVLWSLGTALGDYAAAVRLDPIRPLSHDIASWAPLPIVPAAVALLAVAPWAGERRAWAAAGVVYGLITAALWGHTPLSIVLGVPGMIAGAWVGTRLHHTLTRPTLRGLFILTAVTQILSPAVLGFIDFVLRGSTPT